MMDRPKLTNTNATFDCHSDENFQNKTKLTTTTTSINNNNRNRHHQQQQHCIKQTVSTSDPKPTNFPGPSNENNNIIDFAKYHQPNSMDSQRLSKLTLSSSLHLLNDSKYIHTLNQQQQLGQNFIINQTNSTQIKSEPMTDHQHQQQQHYLNTENHSTPMNYTHTKSNMTNMKQEANLDTVHVVVGNEACDLDSAVSCLLVFHIISKISDEINGKDKTRTLYIPLLNTTRDLLDSKSEVLWFLQKTLNIDKSFLTCKDDIDWAEIKKNGIEVLITLVDHNYNEEFKDIGRIVEIIDHHQVQNPDWLIENHQNMRLTLDTSVGSCTTLVAERLFYIYAEHHVSDEILLLIYGTILLDTICLSEKAKRFTRRDVYLLRKLDSLLGSRKPNRDELYKQLVSAKNSTRELNFEKLMKRDLKVYKDKNGLRIGIASLFGMAAKEALGLAANIDLDQFFCQNNYEAFIIMGLIADLDQSDGISRDLVLISANEQLFGKLCDAFEQDSSKLDLVTIIGGPESRSPDPEDDSLSARTLGMRIGSSAASSVDVDPKSAVSYKTRIWIQRNVTSSRKVVAPLVLKVLHDGAQI